MKLSRNNSYPIHQSPLYKLRGKQQFENLLNIQWELCDPVVLRKKYRIKYDNKRTYQIPVGFLLTLHRKISSLLKKIIKPDYLHSTKKKSYVTNALQHIGSGALIKTDISKYYPSTTFSMVYNLFLQDFKCAGDVAYKLACICCYEQHLPTGSPLSNELAFFSSRRMFDEINNHLVSVNSGLKMSVYVDDITISGQGATKKLLTFIRKLLSKYGYMTKNKKSHTYPENSAKTVTGCIVYNNKLLLPNKQHSKIKNIRKEISLSKENEKNHLLNILTGCLLSAKQISDVNA